MKYRTIVADPPWDHAEPNARWVKRDEGQFLGYPSMEGQEISALPVQELSDNVGEDAHLFLWATSRFLPSAFGIARDWGFHYIATLAWCKPSRGWGLGGTFQNNIEFVLYCRRPSVIRRPEVLEVTSELAHRADEVGLSRKDVDAHMGTSDMAGWWLSTIETRCACPTPEQWLKLKLLLHLGDDLDEKVQRINAAKGTERKEFKQASTGRWFQWPRGAHSAKPEAFLDLVEQVSPGPYLELFARRNRLGWDTWGNEALNHVELSSDVAGGGP